MAEKKLLIKKTESIIEGHLKATQIHGKGHTWIILDTGERTLMPANWSVPFDVYEGDHIRCGWDGNVFIMQKLS